MQDLVWTVDFGRGPQPCNIPHAWHLQAPLGWEGPAEYRTKVNVTQPDLWLLFEGVSYQATVIVQGETVLVHQGVWDAFAVDLSPYSGEIEVIVQVVKNGGASFPVKSALSGFLPYVYHTFGGIYRPVHLIASNQNPLDNYRETLDHLGLIEQRGQLNVRLNGSQIVINDREFYMRGILTWGWYPQLGYPHPSSKEIDQELAHIASIGFNTIKFCLWLPPHEMLAKLADHGLYAWLELPLWMPDHVDYRKVSQELKEIIRQYSHHQRVIAWTLGCELEHFPSGLRDELMDFLAQETACPLIKDNSGGSEMYAAQVDDVGTFEDFHPYCDTHFYLPVLNSLRNGPRHDKPILLGEFNDFDHIRNIADPKVTEQFWFSETDHNEKGVRWQYDFPQVARERTGRWSHHQLENLRHSSISKGHFVRKRTLEYVRQISEIAGYVITGWKDTPISTSGMVDEADQPVYNSSQLSEWNGSAQFFLIPDRKPPWIHGGNRPGWRDTQCHFSGPFQIKIGLHSDEARHGEIRWSLGELAGSAHVSVNPCQPTELLQIRGDLTAGTYHLQVELDELRANWDIHIFDRIPYRSGTRSQNRLSDLESSIPIMQGSLSDLHGDLPDRFIFCLQEGSVQLPFWRECAFDFHDLDHPFVDRWEWLFGLSTDQFFRAEDLDGLGSIEPWISRIDTRNYQEHLVTAMIGGRYQGIVTSLNLLGGSGAQPEFDFNPAAHGMLAYLIKALGSDIDQGV